MKKFLAFLLLAYSLLMVNAVPAYAQVTLDPTYRPENLPTITGTVEDQATTTARYKEANVRVQLVRRFGDIILGLAGVVAVFFIMNNAFFMIASAGNEETVTSHKKGLMWAIVGLLLILLSYSIMRFVISQTFLADQRQPAAPAAAPAAGSIPAVPTTGGGDPSAGVGAEKGQLPPAL